MSRHAAFAIGFVVTTAVLVPAGWHRLDASFEKEGKKLRPLVQSFNLDGSYWYRNTWGVTLAGFVNKGSRDALLYPDTGRPDTNGGIVEFSPVNSGSPTYPPRRTPGGTANRAEPVCRRYSCIPSSRDSLVCIGMNCVSGFRT